METQENKIENTDVLAILQEAISLLIQSSSQLSSLRCSYKDYQAGYVETTKVMDHIQEFLNETKDIILHKKKCKLINGKLSWVLLIENHNIPFNTASAADFFKNFFYKNWI